MNSHRCGLLVDNDNVTASNDRDTKEVWNRFQDFKRTHSHIQDMYYNVLLQDYSSVSYLLFAIPPINIIEHQASLLHTEMGIGKHLGRPDRQIGETR